MSKDLTDLTKEVGKGAKDAIDDLYKESKDDLHKIREAITDTLANITMKLAKGESIESIIEDYDVVTTMQMAEVLARAGEKQAKLIKLTEGLLDKVLCIILRKVLLNL